MNRIVKGTLITLAATGIAAYAFRAPLLEAVADRLTADMFVAADTDAFDPGLPVGERVPPLRALHDGRTVTDLGPFAGPRGIVLFVNRSVDW